MGADHFDSPRVDGPQLIMILRNVSSADYEMLHTTCCIQYARYFDLEHTLSKVIERPRALNVFKMSNSSSWKFYVTLT